jgi:hypothetical protein
MSRKLSDQGALPRAVREALADDNVPDYVEAERKRRNILGPQLEGAEMFRPEAPPRIPLTPVESVSKAPHVDALVADLYTVLLSESAKLRKQVEDPKAAQLDPAGMSRLAKLVDGVKQLTKLQLEREKHDRPEDLSREEMIEALREQLEILESE